jgi:MFS family permease
MPAIPPSSRPRHGSALYPWLVVCVLMLLYTSSFIDRMILNLMVRPIRTDLGISDSEFSYLTGFAFVIMYSIAAVPVGWAVDRWNRRDLIALGVAAWSGMTALCGVAGTYGQLFAARVGVGIGESTLSPAAYSLLSDYFRREQLARALSIFALGIPIGSGLALTIGGPMVQALTATGPVSIPLLGVVKPWHLVFFAIGLPGFVLALLTLVVVREPDRQHSTARSSQRKESASFMDAVGFIWRERGVYSPAFLGQGAFALFGYGAATWYPSYLERVHGLTVAEAGTLLGASTAILGSLGFVVAGSLTDRWLSRGHADAHLLVGILYAAGLLVCGVVGPLASAKWLALVFVAATALFAFTWLGSCVALVQLVTPSCMRGQVSAIYLFFINLLALGLGPTAVALVTDHVFHDDRQVGGALAIVAFLSISAGLGVLQLGRRAVCGYLSARNLQSVAA